LIPNAVDVQHFRRPRVRPQDLPESPVAVYVGSLHDARIDVGLIVELACALPELRLAFVGPNALGRKSQQQLGAISNVLLLGPRPYADVPAYLQHADVVIVPHRLSSFTESLDPIKAYECLSVDTPTVATPVSGFREHASTLTIAERDVFPARVAEILQSNVVRHENYPPGWEERALEFEDALRRAAAKGKQS
jgi:glycosyltransferase involved in cell wall biosynthesis